MFSNQLFHHKMVNYWLDNFDKGHVFCILDYPGSYRLWLTESLIKLKAVKGGFQMVLKGEFL